MGCNVCTFFLAAGAAYLEGKDLYRATAFVTEGLVYEVRYINLSHLKSSLTPTKGTAE